MIAFTTPAPFIRFAKQPTCTTHPHTPPSANISTNPTPYPIHLSPSAQTVATLYLPAPSQVLQTARWAGPGGGRRGGRGAGRGRGENSGDGQSYPGYPTNASALSMLIRLARRYNIALTNYPLLTKSLSAAVLAAMSDILAQFLTQPTTDLQRVARYAVYGLIAIGPMGHFWHLFLDRAVLLPGPQAVLAKVFLDQFAFSPLNTLLFFSVMKLAEGVQVAATCEFLRNNFFGTMRDSYRLWPLVNVVNFSIVPSQYRVVFTSAVSIFWIAFLSVVANSERHATCDDPSSPKTVVQNNVYNMSC